MRTTKNMMSNVVSGAIGGVLTLVIVGACNGIRDETVEREHMKLVNMEISRSYNELCVYFGTRDHYSDFDPDTLVDRTVTTMKEMVERDLVKLERDAKRELLAIVYAAKNDLAGDDLFRKTYDRSDENGKSLFSGFHRYESIYFDPLRHLVWLQLPAQGCADHRDLFFNSR